MEGTSSETPTFGEREEGPRRTAWVCGPGGGGEAPGVPGLIFIMVTSSQDLPSAA